MGYSKLLSFLPFVLPFPSPSRIDQGSIGWIYGILFRRRKKGALFGREEGTNFIYGRGNVFPLIPPNFSHWDEGKLRATRARSLDSDIPPSIRVSPLLMVIRCIVILSSNIVRLGRFFLKEKATASDAYRRCRYRYC